MTRTRTQTTLTRLAKLVANLHGEIEAVKRVARERPEHEQVLAARRQKLEADREAVYLTLKQFDPELDGAHIRALRHRDGQGLPACEPRQSKSMPMLMKWSGAT